MSDYDYLGELRLFTVAEGAAALHKSEDWYIKQLRARRLPGRKVGRDWMLSRADIAAAIELSAMPAVAAVKPDPAGLSAGSRRRHTARRRAAA